MELLVTADRGDRGEGENRSIFLSLGPLLSIHLLVLTVLKDHSVDVIATKDAPPKDQLPFMGMIFFTKHGTATTGAFHLD